MRKRVMLFAAPLCVVAIAASVAAASPSDAEHLRGPKLDKLHAERPIAATTRTAHISTGSPLFKAEAKAIQDYVQFRAVTTYIQARMIQDYLAYQAAVDAASQAAVPQSASSSVYSDSNPGDFLSCVRNRESGGNYGVYNAGGSGAAGAYQFLPGTWNSIAASVGRGDLVGVDPAQAAPADQDAMAQALYAQQGSAPWGGGC
jgi:muramidase (phage lysozyme)